jgi:hypothetical protein
VTTPDTGLPIEAFVQALTTQLDRAQEAMAVKARIQKLPLTFAVKDVTLELRAHVDFTGSTVRIRPAGPGDPEASTLHLALTTITEPMIEENTRITAPRPGDLTLKELLGDQITEDEQRRLEWAGVQSVSQLRELERTAGSAVLERVSQLPVDRLRNALRRAAQPRVRQVIRVPAGDGAPPLLRVQGDNLMREQPPAVSIRGERVPVVEASETELLVGPLGLDLRGALEVETGPGEVTAFPLDPPQDGVAAKDGLQ